MKKSYDYFKTLKEMSDCIGNAFSYRFKPDKYKKEILLFHANRKELSESLSEEFVAPIERNDIYNISSCLVGEVVSLDYLCLFSLENKETVYDKKFSDFFVIQSNLIIGLSDKNYESLLGDVSTAQNSLNNQRNKMISMSKDIFNKSENILLEYAFFEKLLRFIESVGKTFYELERVIINNI